ncbi:MAG: hypothetical protein JNK42_04215 [Caedimonas sp.]|nr:hypothetical protein [Caedimonas sp.]
MISFTFMGDKILDWLKISDAAFYIAGGLLYCSERLSTWFWHNLQGG